MLIFLVVTEVSIISNEYLQLPNKSFFKINSSFIVCLVASTEGCVLSHVIRLQQHTIPLPPKLLNKLSMTYNSAKGAQRLKLTLRCYVSKMPQAYVRT